MNTQSRVKPVKLATYDDVLAAPPHMVAEVLNGELHLHPRPLWQHGNATSVLGSDINSAFQRGRGGPGGWWITIEPEIHLGSQIVVPDIAGWRKERLPGGPVGPFATIAPDWVCEVLSPSTRTHDLTTKREIYGQHGVGHLWFVDPDAKTLEAFALRDGAWVLIAALSGEADVSVAPFDAITFPLGELWAPDPPEADET